MQQQPKECEVAYENPKCPYVTMINRHTENLVKVETDVGWLKRGYWVEVVFSGGTLVTVLGLVFWLATGHQLPV